jgi:hypothetical protein
MSARHHGAGAQTVLGMHVLEIRLEARLECLGRDPVDAVERLRPDYAPALGAPLPPAEPRELLRLGEQRALLAKRLLGEPAVGDVARDHADPARGGELDHQAHVCRAGDLGAALVLHRLAARHHLGIVLAHRGGLAPRKELLVPAAEHLLATQRVAGEEARIDEAVAAVSVLEAHESGAIVGKGNEQRLRLPRLLLGRVPLGEVTRDLGEADETSRLVADRVEHRERPEAAAVLAQAPALLGEAPGGACRLERALGLAPGAVLGGEKERKMPPEHLALGVALNALRARVPARDLALGREHVDRVVGDALNEEAKAPLAFAPARLDRAALRDVPHLGDEARRGSLAVDDARDAQVGPDHAAVLAQIALLELEAPGPGAQRLLQQPPALAEIVGVRDIEHRFLAQLRLGVAEQREKARVGAEVAAAAVDDRDALRRLVECRGEELLALALRVALGHVARDLGVAFQRSVRVAQRGDHHFRPEAAAVLAHAPAFAFEAPVARRVGERSLGLAGGAVFGRVEKREMPADDLGGAIALDALGAGVPARHAARGVEQVDRMTGYARHQDAELLVGRVGAARDTLGYAGDFHAAGDDDNPAGRRAATSVFARQVPRPM